MTLTNTLLARKGKQKEVMNQMMRVMSGPLSGTSVMVASWIELRLLPVFKEGSGMLLVIERGATKMSEIQV